MPIPAVVYFPAPYVRQETRQFQLTQHLAAHRPVYFIEDSPEPSKGLIPRLRLDRAEDQVMVIARHRSAGYERLTRRLPSVARRIQKRGLTSIMGDLGVSRFWLYTLGAFPDWPDRNRHLLRAVEVIDPVFFGDEAAQWEAVAERARRADLVTVTAASLGDELTARAVSSHRLPNAVSATLLSPDETSRSTYPSALYVGTLDWRFDFELVERAARSLPGCTFTIAGRVLPDFAEDARRLAELDNVTVTGAVSEETKTRLLREAWVGLVPFRRGTIADGVNPTKVYEYASYGLRIVSGPSRACRELSPPVRVGEDVHGFISAIAGAVDAGPSSDESRALAATNTWTVRAATLDELMTSVEHARRERTR